MAVDTDAVERPPLGTPERARSGVAIRRLRTVFELA
jgi:hypothetical protein